MYCVTFVVWNRFIFEKMSAEENTFNLRKEQCRVVHVFVEKKKKKKKTPIEYYLMMYEAYRDQVMSRWQVFHRHKQFKEGCALSVTIKQSGRHVSNSTGVMIDTIGTLITNDSLLTRCEIAALVGIKKGTVQKVCHNCLIVHNPIGVNFSAFVWMARTSALFIQLTCNLGVWEVKSVVSMAFL